MFMAASTIAGGRSPRNVPAMQDFDFAVVGAGIAGVSAAYYLARRQASSFSKASTCPPITRPAARRRCIRRPTAAPEIRAITVASGRFYRKPPKGFADHALLTPAAR